MLAAGPQRELPGRGSARHEKSVVLVDPDACWRLAARAQLEGGGFQVIEASSALQALHAIGATPVSVVATNYPMRLPGGTPLARIIRALPELSRVFVIAVTSDARRENFAAACADGCRAVVLKPAPEALLDVVELVTTLSLIG